jgi:hypothetical protein
LDFFLYRLVISEKRSDVNYTISGILTGATSDIRLCHTYNKRRLCDKWLNVYGSAGKPFEALEGALEQLISTFEMIRTFGLDETLLQKVSADAILNPSKWAEELKAAPPP